MTVTTQRTTYLTTIGVAQLSLSTNAVLQRMGYASDHAPEHLIPLIESHLRSRDHDSSARVGFRIYEEPHVAIEREILRCGDVVFDIGPIIGRGIRGSDAIAVFVATAGEEISRDVKAYFEKSETLEGYVLDTIASEIVERAVDWMEIQLAKSVGGDGWKISNRYSPGYCGWDVAEQHRLFALLPKNFCGVTLTESALMVPVKSASGIIGLGRNTEKRDYECSLCDVDECVIRNRNE